MSTGLPDTLVTALAANSTNVFAGFNGSGIFHSTDNGISWSTVNSGLTNHYILCLTFSGTNLFAGTDSGLFISTNNGASWTAVNNGLPKIPVAALVVNGTNFFAGTLNGVFF